MGANLPAEVIRASDSCQVSLYTQGDALDPDAEPHTRSVVRLLRPAAEQGPQ